MIKNLHLISRILQNVCQTNDMNWNFRFDIIKKKFMCTKHVIDKYFNYNFRNYIFVVNDAKHVITFLLILSIFLQITLWSWISNNSIIKFINMSIQRCKKIIKKMNNSFLKIFEIFCTLIFITITYVSTNEFVDIKSIIIATYKVFYTINLNVSKSKIREFVKI